MGRRRQINIDPGCGGGRLAGLLDRARWPFERLLWLLEARVLWPLREALAGRFGERRGAGAAALATIAAAAAIAAVAMLPGGKAPSERVAQPAKVAIAEAPDAAGARDAKTKAAPRQTAATELKGAPPDFSAGASGTSAPSGSGSDAGSGSADSADAGSAADGEAEGAEPGEATGAATSGARKPVSPGRRAMRVARRFSEAFVFYEIGRRRERAEEIFAETATPRLAKALGERPPRQPAGGKVPKARVVNMVPGPRAGRTYTVSASLLRVGVTTELRLELRRDGKRNWLVTDVRG